MTEKINVLQIIKDHFGTLRSYRTGKTSIPDWLVFLAFPLVASAAITWTRFSFKADVLIGILSAFSIFAGLLLNLLVLICGLAGNQRFGGSDAAAETRRRFLKEIHENLSFSILISISIVVLSLIAISVMRFLEQAPGQILTTHPVVTFLLTSLLINFVLTLLMILRRIHVLLSLEFERPSMKRAS